MIARCFWTGFSLAFTSYSAIISKCDKTNRDVLKVAFIDYGLLFSLPLLLVVMFLKCFWDRKFGRNLKTRGQNLFDFKVGLAGMIFLGTFQYASFWVILMTDFQTGYLCLIISYHLYVIVFGYFVAFETIDCRFSMKFSYFDAYLWSPIGAVSLWNLMITFDIDLLKHFFYIASIGYLFYDAYFVISNPSKVFFLSNYFGKNVICETRKGAVIRGKLEKTYGESIYISNAEYIYDVYRSFGRFEIEDFDDIREDEEKEVIDYKKKELLILP